MKQVRQSWNQIASMWCAVVHEAATWPIHGHYRCPKCNRRYSIPWK
jgi:hypothetical protein